MKNYKIVETPLKADQYLFDTETQNDSEWGEAHPYIIAKKGEMVNIFIDYYKDGRIYYTAFRKVDGVYYTYTHMKKNNELILNCGGLRASMELKQILG